MKKLKYPRTKVSAYLLGIALGDGNLVKMPRCLKLRLFCDIKYPILIKKWVKACSEVFPKNKVSVVHRVQSNIDVVYVHSKVLEDMPWSPIAGAKVLQDIRIPKWISEKGYDVDCIRGLFESDGCIYVQKISKKGKMYRYRRIGFSNSSEGIVAFVKQFLDKHKISFTIYQRKEVHYYKGKMIKNNKPNIYFQVIDYKKFQKIVSLVKS